MSDEGILQNDPICAPATPAGEGAIAVIRVSGEGAIQTVAGVFKSAARLQEAPPNSANYGRIIGEKGETIDDVIAVVFRSPNSYTGEDAVEISCHGSPFIVERIVRLLLSRGARLAEPGEFTKRAFLNGKIDLAQAEAVAETIRARTEAARRGAREQLDGKLSSRVAHFRKELVEASSLLELELDFAEEDIEFVEPARVVERIDAARSEIAELVDSYRRGKIIRDGVHLAVVGAPNVGKSSLLNWFLKEGRAIVSETPGATRDVIREEAAIDGILFKIYDTAGIRETSEEIEREGVRRSREAVANADVVLLLDAADLPPSEALARELRESVGEERLVRALNKIDLDDSRAPDYDVAFSVKTDRGGARLIDLLKRKALGGVAYSERSAITANARHLEALKRANEFLGIARDSLAEGMSGEFVAADLRNAERALAEIIGEVTTDDVLDNIFDNFCIGK